MKVFPGTKRRITMKRALNPTHLKAIMKMASGESFFSHMGIRLAELDYGYAKAEPDIDKTFT